MVKVLVAFTKPGWQQNVKSVLSRERTVSASYAELGKTNLKLYTGGYDVVFLQTGRDRETLSRYLPEIKARYPRSRLVLVLDNFGITDIVFGHRMGISALIDETATSEQLLNSLSAALRGDLYVASSIVQKSQSTKKQEPAAFSVEPEESRQLSRLSDREIEVLRLVAKGMSNRLIAKTLFISEKTVKNHLYNIFKKIGVTDRTKAALLAVRTLMPVSNESFGPSEVFVESDG
ncbi:MAG TPA: response regulator transcription factor [Firmicutes bacterium]|nr:response regulator transcription factor [Candidatus Fermentithermobacillaceae bacterium]